MKIIVGKYSGFCSGVKKAVDLAFLYASPDTYTYGQIIHNEAVTDKLALLGVKCVDSTNSGLAKPPLTNSNSKPKIIIRSHGVGEQVYTDLETQGFEVLDATCSFVKKIHQIVSKYYSLGYHILIVGYKEHPEVIGINGWCNNSAAVIESESELDFDNLPDKLCVVCQTTFLAQKYLEIIEKIKKNAPNSLEIFDTICYTTSVRQKEAEDLARKCDTMLVVGSASSSNTGKLLDICKKHCKRSYLISNIETLQKIYFDRHSVVGIVGGASAQPELIREVYNYMSQNFSEANNEEFLSAIEQPLVSYRVGRRISGTVLSSGAEGIRVSIGGKLDGLILPSEVGEGEFDPSEYKAGDKVDAVITNKKCPDTNCVLLSKKQVDRIKEGGKFVEDIRDGQPFEVTIEKEIKGGLLGRIGSYEIFIPGSQASDKFTQDLKQFAGKTLTVTAIEIDDIKQRVVASARKLLETERKEREAVFWGNIVPNVIVTGKVKRMTNFGAFVSVDGFDCLAHIIDLSWNRIKNPDEVLKLDEEYDFVVLNVDKEKGRVSLGYKQLHPHPFVSAAEKYPVGQTVKGKVVRLVPFGVFIELEPGVDGLVHVSEASHTFVKNLNEIFKVGQVIDVMVMGVDVESHKINLSVKSCTEPPTIDELVESAETSGKKGKKGKERSAVGGPSEYNDEEQANNPFADLLKDFDNK
ncbi:MAG: bifunctional 4-hydroxy-3-methylbut-2-enyl diphosphate reductase/30S ribosomal protein S1 [Firmicutes bacterium]|nr:bifunctional 4-hydroxy-3-methylbut-2-enyl diphosphate reductase/30S ribosomal protein S1 [Bacillota bacterium]